MSSDDEEGGEFEYEMLLEGIVETMKSEYPGFDEPSKKKWDGKETRIILEGHGVQVGLSEYCDLWSLSVRVNENDLEYASSDEEYESMKKDALDWINTNWAEASKYWDDFRKVGTFSNGESVFELKTK